MIANICCRTCMRCRTTRCLHCCLSCCCLPLPLAAAALSPMLLNGWLFTLKPLQPQLSKLNSVTGIGRMFYTNSLVDLLKAIAKALAVGLV